MTEKLLRDLANSRIQESKVLLDNKCYNGAYYLCGYAIECALKACIAKNIKASEIPDRKFINDIFTHDVKSLVRLAGLEGFRVLKNFLILIFRYIGQLLKTGMKGHVIKSGQNQRQHKFMRL